MNIDITIDFSRYPEQTLDVTGDFRAATPPVALTLPALVVHNGVSVHDLAVADGQGQAVPYTVTDDRLLVQASTFRVRYALHVRHTQCLGSDKSVYFTYPFVNEREIFVGAGAIPYPSQLPHLAETTQATIQLRNVPHGWQPFANFAPGLVSPAVLDSFVLYCAPEQGITQHTFDGVGGPIDFRLCVQRGKTIPLTPNELWDYLDGCCRWLEHKLVPLSHVSQFNILILQAPANFVQLAGGRSFATGENMLGGIAVYAPPDPAYLQKLFGHRSYRDFLYDGFMHELLHCLTSSSWQGRYKSILYPAAACPPADARLLGEALTIYFHDQYVRYHLTGSDEPFVTETVLAALQRRQERGRPEPLLALFLLDIYLQQQGSSLLILFRLLLERQRRLLAPYSSIAVLFDTLQQALGIELPAEYRASLQGTQTADEALLAVAFRQRGYSLVRDEDRYGLEKREAKQE